MNCNRIVTRGLCTGHLLITRGFGKRRKKIELEIRRRRRGRSSKMDRKPEEECKILLLTVSAELRLVDGNHIGKKSISPEIIQYKDKQELWVKCGKPVATKVCAKPIDFRIKAYKKPKKCQVVESVFDLSIVESLDYNHKKSNSFTANAKLNDIEIRSLNEELSITMDERKFIRIKSFGRRA